MANTPNDPNQPDAFDKIFGKRPQQNDAATPQTVRFEKLSSEQIENVARQRIAKAKGTENTPEKLTGLIYRMRRAIQGDCPICKGRIIVFPQNNPDLVTCPRCDTKLQCKDEWVAAT